MWSKVQNPASALSLKKFRKYNYKNTTDPLLNLADLGVHQIGELKFIKIGHDNSGAGPSWHLQVGGLTHE
jgi:hypothetical protein